MYYYAELTKLQEMGFSFNGNNLVYDGGLDDIAATTIKFLTTAGMERF
ncbi:MAG: hypothetical protein R2847_01930 [Bacteroidia bacterium]